MTSRHHAHAVTGTEQPKEAGARVRYVLMGQVIAVQERFEVMGGRKGADGQTEIMERSIGWFLQLSAGASLYVGPDKPEIAKGDTIRMTIEVQA